MRAIEFIAENTVRVVDVPTPEPGFGEVRVDLRASALNHRDLWILKGQYAGVRHPCVPGSDGAGVVGAVGAGVDGAWLGREVVINPALDWGDDEAHQGPGFTILGLPRPGTLAESVCVPATQLAARPGHLNWDQAAALPLAGLTAYRAVRTRANVQPGERVLVTGTGGGVATLALQFGVALGAEVWVTSSSAAKREEAVRRGARGGFDYADADWVKDAAERAGGFDVIVDSAGGPGFEALIDAAAPGGRIVFFGATRGNPPLLPVRKVFWRQLSLLGTTMGSPHDWAGMLAFVERHRLVPVVSEVFPLDRAKEAFVRMESGEQCGKIVLRP
jgi:zinc-binding alcohol dehydrogenase/oxidoreductase